MKKETQKNDNVKENKNKKKTNQKKVATSNIKKETANKSKKVITNKKSKPAPPEETNKKDGKFRVDILDILIIVVLTSIVSCVLTGLILNYQYKHSSLNKQLNTDENISKFLNTYSEISDKNM